MSYEREFNKLARRYKELRLKHGMIQEDVLEHDFSVRHYQQLEAGRPHSLKTFFKLAEMFGVSPEELIQGVFETRNGSRKRKNKFPA